ncbi:MAG: hypothetical protein OEY89_10040 [Gammaproteobacteria bacterium]|nr:hypothetical protein [Gammaproteobacteria bacterium]
MPSEFISLFIGLIVALFVLALVYSGIDASFNTVDGVVLENIIQLNMWFVLYSGLTMLVFLIIGLSYERLIIHIPNREGLSIASNLAIIFAILFFIKHYMTGLYGLVFSFQLLVIGVEIAMLFIIPFIAYRVIGKFGKAFKH